MSGNGHHESGTQSTAEQSQFAAAETASILSNTSAASVITTSAPVALEDVGLDVCNCISDNHQELRPPTEITLNESAATHTALPRAHGTQDEVRDRSSEVEETWRQMSRSAAAAAAATASSASEKSTASRSHREFTTLNSASRSDEEGEVCQCKTTPSNCDAGDVRLTHTADNRKLPRRRHSLTSLNSSGKSRTTGTQRDVSDDVAAATPPQVRGVTVTSSTTMALRGDVTATSRLPGQHLSTCSPSSSSFQRQHHQHQSPADVRRMPYSTSLYTGNWDRRSIIHTNSDQSHRPNRFATATGPLKQTTVITVVGKPVETATQTR